MGDQPATIRFSVPLPPRGLRRNSETRVQGWRSKLKRAWQEEIWCAGHAKKYRPGMSMMEPQYRKPWERAAVTYIWRSTHATDVDNIIASMKPALDVLKATGPRPLGIIRDDGPGVTVEAQWEKARRKVNECVEIEVRRL